MFAVSMIGTDVETVSEIDITELVKHIDNGNIENIVMVDNTLKGKLKDETQFITVFPPHIVERFYIENIEPLVEAGEISVAAEIGRASCRERV